MTGIKQIPIDPHNTMMLSWIAVVLLLLMCVVVVFIVRELLIWLRYKVDVWRFGPPSEEEDSRPKRL